MSEPTPEDESDPIATQTRVPSESDDPESMVTQTRVP